jgi:uncharacterized protein YceK
MERETLVGVLAWTAAIVIVLIIILLSGCAGTIDLKHNEYKPVEILTSADNEMDYENRLAYSRLDKCDKQIVDQLVIQMDTVLKDKDWYSCSSKVNSIQRPIFTMYWALEMDRRTRWNAMRSGTGLWGDEIVSYPCPSTSWTLLAVGSVVSLYESFTGFDICAERSN